MKRMMAGAALALCGVLFGFAFATATDAKKQAGWWELLGAFGSAGAALGAVAIAGWQYTVQRQERYIEAVHVVCEAYPRLVALKVDLEDAHGFFKELLNVDQSPDLVRREIDTLKNAYIDAALPEGRRLISLGGPFSLGMVAVRSHLDTAFRRAGAADMSAAASRRAAAVVLLNAIDVAVPRLRDTADTAYRLFLENGAAQVRKRSRT